MSDLHPEGYFDAVVTGAEFGQTGNGKSQWAIHCNVGGEARTVFLSFEGNAKPYTVEKLQRLGFNGDVDNPEFSAPACSVSCKYEEYNGVLKERWDLARGLQLTPATPDQKLAFKRDWKATAAPAPARPAGKPSTPPAPPSRPAAAPPARPAKAAFGKSEAWSAIAARVPNIDATRFYEAVEQVEADTGKKEAVFGDAEWRAVDNAYIAL